MAVRTPDEFIQHLREIYGETISDRRFVYPEWFKEKGARLQEAYRQLACAYLASADVHAKQQTRFEWTLDVNTKIKLARQVWEEARHAKDVCTLLRDTFQESFQIKDHEAVPELKDCFYGFYFHIEDAGAYFAAHNAAGERTALYMLEEAAAQARATGQEKFAQFAEKVIPEERLHVRLGEEIVKKYAAEEADQERLEKFFRDGIDAHWKYTEAVYQKIGAIPA